MIKGAELWSRQGQVRWPGEGREREKMKVKVGQRRRVAAIRRQQSHGQHAPPRCLSRQLPNLSAPLPWQQADRWNRSYGALGNST